MTVILAHLICIASALPNSASDLERAISALEGAITPLENSSGCWEKSLPWFTGLVVIGLIADLVVIVRERREETAHWHRWTKIGLHFPDRPSRAMFLLELFGTSAIFLGVAGELWAGAEIAYINGQLRSKNAELRIKSNELVELLHKEAEQLKSENLQLEAVIAPRRLSLDQQRLIADACRKFHGHGVSVRSYALDTEGLALTEQVIAALRAAKIDVADGKGLDAVSGELEYGVHVRTTDDAERMFASTIANALSSIGKLKVYPVNDPPPKGAVIATFSGGYPFTSPHKTSVNLRIGAKPAPILSSK